MVPSTELPAIDVDGHFKVVPFSVLDYRSINREGKEVQQGLVQWTEDHADAAEWVDLKILRRKFDFPDPCGQGSENPEGIVMNVVDLVNKGEDEMQEFGGKKALDAIIEEEIKGLEKKVKYEAEVEGLTGEEGKSEMYKSGKATLEINTSG